MACLCQHKKIFFHGTGICYLALELSHGPCFKQACRCQRIIFVRIWSLTCYRGVFLSSVSHNGTQKPAVKTVKKFVHFLSTKLLRPSFSKLKYDSTLKQWQWNLYRYIIHNATLILLYSQCSGSVWSWTIRIRKLDARIRIFLLTSKYAKKNLDSYCFVTFFMTLSLWNYVNISSQNNNQKLRKIVKRKVTLTRDVERDQKL